MIAQLSPVRAQFVKPFVRKAPGRSSVCLSKTRAMANPLFEVYVKGEKDILGDCALPVSLLD